MKFLGSGTIWDTEKDVALCSFVDGVFETKDLAIIKKIKDAMKFTKSIKVDTKKAVEK